MRKTWIEAVSFAVLLAGITVASGQPGLVDFLTSEKPPKKDEKKATPKSKLEEMLEQALQNNPDIRVAEAKVREAEAELNRTRLLVTQKVVALQAALDAARANVDAATLQLKHLEELSKSGAVHLEKVGAATAALQQAKAELAKLEAEAPYITGQHPKAANTEAAVERGLEWLRLQEMERVRAQREMAQVRYAATMALAQKAWEADNIRLWEANKPAADKLRAALNKPLTLEVNQKELSYVLALLRQDLPDMQINVKGSPDLSEKVATARFKDVPVAVVLQWFEASLPDYQAYVRDYGVLFLPAAQRPPSGAVPLREFLKADKTEKKDKPEKE